MLSHCNKKLFIKQQGFNLFELLIVLGLIAITLGLLVPSGQATLEKSRLTSATNEAYSALLFTRNEALRLKTNASLCFVSSITATACGTEVSELLAIFVEDELKRTYPITEQTSLNFHGVADNRIRFENLGNRTSSDGDVYLEVTAGNLKRQIDVCFNGRIAIRKNDNECK